MSAVAGDNWDTPPGDVLRDLEELSDLALRQNRARPVVHAMTRGQAENVIRMAHRSGVEMRPEDVPEELRPFLAELKRERRP